MDRYANGVSPVGCYDMAGNVLEWSSVFYDADEDSYVHKGGSWNFPAEYARCAKRSNSSPFNRLNLVDFRCARTKE